MINLIAWTACLYLVQLMLPNFLKSGSNNSKRARKAFRNLGESLPIFLMISRVLFLIIYISGVGKKNKGAEGDGNEAQPIRSLVWMVSVVLLVLMAKNLL